MRVSIMKETEIHIHVQFNLADWKVASGLLAGCCLLLLLDGLLPRRELAYYDPPARKYNSAADTDFHSSVP